jgi:8-oxo-dGTP pyrophosphatase MutT (NUDIX family)
VAFDPNRPPATPRDAAAVILLRAREGDGKAEVFLLRRHRKSSFMARSFVFPGGGVDADEDHLRAAARELFEEAGVLLVEQPLGDARRAELRQRVLDGDDFNALLSEAELTLTLDTLQPFSHWITPSAEPKRFSAYFYVGVLPAGQTPSFDNVETVDEAWVTPAEALQQATELLLPPPQVRTLHDLVQAGCETIEAILELARGRAEAIEPIVPRFKPEESAPKGFSLLLPWDPGYETEGQGEGTPFPADHPFAGGPSRFVLQDDGTWAHV